MTAFVKRFVSTANTSAGNRWCSDVRWNGVLDHYFLLRCGALHGPGGHVKAIPQLLTGAPLARLVAHDIGEVRGLPLQAATQLSHIASRRSGPGRQPEPRPRVDIARSRGRSVACAGPRGGTPRAGCQCRQDAEQAGIGDERVGGNLHILDTGLQGKGYVGGEGCPKGLDRGQKTRRAAALARAPCLWIGWWLAAVERIVVIKAVPLIRSFVRRGRRARRRWASPRCCNGGIRRFFLSSLLNFLLFPLRLLRAVLLIAGQGACTHHKLRTFAHEGHEPFEVLVGYKPLAVYQRAQDRCVAVGQEDGAEKFRFGSTRRL